MSDFVLSCCSAADLSEELLRERDIHYIPFHFYVNDRHYADDLGRSMSFADFYKAVREGAETRTSQVNAEEFVAYFTPFLQAGQDILHVCLSSGLSGVGNSANLAKAQLEAQFPERKIFIIDSLGASAGYGLLMDKLAELRDEGMGIEELAAWAESHRLELHHWFFSADLSAYIKGGRISKAAGLVGTVLQICPLLDMNERGELTPREKLRGKAKAIKEIVRKMQENACGGADYNDKCFISQSDCMEDAADVACLVEKTFPKLNGRVRIFSVGTAIGSHTGAGTVALFFWGKRREAEPV